MMRPLGAQQRTPAEQADDAVRELLRTQWQGLPAVRLDSPPGAGKTVVAELVAIQSVELMGERCMLVTQTNEQAFDLARRLCERRPGLPLWMYVRNGLPMPAYVRRLSGLRITTDVQDVPPGPCAVIANAAKWSWVRGSIPRFDVQFVDEAFQLLDARFQQIAGLADRIVLIGDPGQIAPIVRSDVDRWRSDSAGPHVACPRALLARKEGVVRLSLPVSRRLVADTVEFVQPAFYPDLQFEALGPPGERGVEISIAGATGLDRAINLVRDGASLVQVELPSLITGEVDGELADTIVALIQRLFERGAQVRDEGVSRPLEPGMVGVVCTHVSQVEAVRERLPRGLAEVFVETSDRFQGLQRPIIIVHHPLSGRRDGSEFHLDAGRLCVMLSRHRVACFVVTRGGVEDLLLRFTPGGNRVLGIPDDPEYDGWRANLTIQEQLRTRGRVIRVAGR